MKNSTALNVGNDKTETGSIEWYVINGTDFGTNCNFENETVGLNWKANSYTIVDSENCPITEGDLNWTAIKNVLIKAGFLTSAI